MSPSEGRLLADAPGVPIESCLRRSPEELGADADELASLGGRMGLDLSDEERALLPAYGYDVQAALGQANAVALARREQVQEQTGVTPAALDQAVATQRALLRVQAGAAQLGEDAADGLRFLQALAGFGCQQLLDWIEEERRRASPEELELLQGLVVPLRDFLARKQAQAKAKDQAAERHLRPLAGAAADAQAHAEAMRTLLAVDDGEALPDEAVTTAAAVLSAPKRGETHEMRDRRGSPRPPRGGKRR